MKNHSSRRSFLRKTAAASLSVPFVKSLEEYALAAQAAGPAQPPAAPPAARSAVPTGKIGNLQISRLICGANLIGGFAHSRDLIYVSPLLKHYFTDEKILETWAGCEAAGVNTIILFPDDKRAAGLYAKHRSQGGRLQMLAQVSPTKTDLKSAVQRAKDAGAVGAYLLGNLGDSWTRDGDARLIAELITYIKDQKLLSGTAGHELRTVMEVEKTGCAPDFYLKTLHEMSYWSKRRPDQMKEVIDNYGVDNYWCMDPKQTVDYMSELRRPWIAYKVLAAGAIHPRAGFKYAFQNGADFVAVGMFDFQIAEDAAIAAETVNATQNRDREWLA